MPPGAVMESQEANAVLSKPAELGPKAMDRQQVCELLRRIAFPDTTKEDITELLSCLPREGTIADGFGFPAISVAAMHGNDKAMSALLDHGIDPHTKDPNSHTPLMIALRGHGRSFERCVGAIMKASEKNGDWLELRDSAGMNAAHCAARAGNAEVLEALVGLGADVNAVDNRKRTPLHYAALKARFRTCRILLKLGAVVDAVDNEGNTPAVACALELAHVHEAAYRRRLSSVGDFGRSTPARGSSEEDKREEDWRRATVELLVAKGAETERANKWGKSLWMLARNQKWLEEALLSEYSSSSQEGECVTSQGNGVQGVPKIRLTAPQIRARRAKLCRVPKFDSPRDSPVPHRDSSLEDEAFDAADEKRQALKTDEDEKVDEEGKEGRFTWDFFQRTVKFIALFVLARYVAFHVVGWLHSSPDSID